MTPRIEVVHVGSASRDLTEEDPRGWRLGGAVCYASLSTARSGLRTMALVGVDAIASEAQELDLLRDAGVDVRTIRVRETPVFINEESPDGRIQTCVTSSAPLFVQGDLADAVGAIGWSFLPVAGELDDGWVDALPRGVHLTVGWQGWLRDLVPGHRVARRAPRSSRILARADLVGVSLHDLAPNTRLHDLTSSIRPGASLLRTDGIRGGQLHQIPTAGRMGSTRYRAIPAAGIVDPTGAGDVMLASLQAAILRPDITGQAAGSDRRVELAFAAAAASLTVEGPGLAGVPTLEAVRARVLAWQHDRAAGSAGE